MANGDNSDKLLQVLAYPSFGLIGIVLFFTKRDDRESRYHALNSIFFWVAIGIITTVLGFVLGMIPVLGCAVVFILPAINLAAFIYAIMLAMQVHKGETPVIPYITDFAKKYVDGE